MAWKYHRCDYKGQNNYEVIYTESGINTTNKEPIYSRWQLRNVYDGTFPLRDAPINNCPFCGVTLKEECVDCGYVFETGLSKSKHETPEQMKCSHSNLMGREKEEETE